MQDLVHFVQELPRSLCQKTQDYATTKDFQRPIQAFLRR